MMKKPIFLTALLLAGVSLSGCVPLDDGYHRSRPVYRYGSDADYHYRLQERRDWERRQARQQREMQRRATSVVNSWNACNNIANNANSSKDAKCSVMING